MVSSFPVNTIPSRHKAKHGAMMCDSGLMFVDTMGWEDADADDTDTFQAILHFLDRQGLTEIQAVLWTLHPGSIRVTGGLRRQAAFIDMFAEREIWDNVVVICGLCGVQIA